MDEDLKTWLHDATDACVRAKERGIAVLFRNDDYEVIVCSSQDAAVIKALGEALACGYSGSTGSSDE